MATIGHTLIGLSLAGLRGNGTKRRILRNAWPGFVVLLAHVVDLVEWLVWLVAPPAIDNHVLTHSVWLTAVVVGLTWLGLRFLAGVRSLWPFLVSAIAVFSHLLLDNRRFQTILAEVSGFPSNADMPILTHSIVAEVWCYGLLLVGMLLFQAQRQADCPRRGRLLAALLGGLSLAGAASRIVAVWAPAYLLSLLHATILLRRGIRRRLAWNLVPLAPLILYLAVIASASALLAQADALQAAGDYRGAIRCARASLVFGSRVTVPAAQRTIGFCHLKSGELAEAEAAYRAAEAASDGSVGSLFSLAGFYVASTCRNTPFFRPEQTRRILLRLQTDRYGASTRRHAQQMAERLKAAGILR
ncbi:MAG: hypothetical protein ACE5E1_03020 [Phycisphaerae bacterium]